jgi:endonuclease-3
MQQLTCLFAAATFSVFGSEMMNPTKKQASESRITKIIGILERSYDKHDLARITAADPFKTLVGGILSARAKDTQTAPVCCRLFARATDAQSLLAIPEPELIEIIRPIGFYNEKSRSLRRTCEMLIERRGGRVPDTLDELTALAGVGRKVANLVLSVAFGKDAICVDTHVHRITNRLGWVETEDVLATEMRLMQIVPRKLWRIVNFVFVRHGQECCQPTSPWCSRCPIASSCARVGVARSR